MREKVILAGSLHHLHRAERAAGAVPCGHRRPGGRRGGAVCADDHEPGNTVRRRLLLGRGLRQFRRFTPVLGGHRHGGGTDPQHLYVDPLQAAGEPS